MPELHATLTDHREAIQYLFESCMLDIAEWVLHGDFARDAGACSETEPDYRKKRAKTFRQCADLASDLGMRSNATLFRAWAEILEEGI